MAVDLDTRDAPVARACGLLADAAAAVDADQVLLAKIDSTLRGHVAAVLETLAETLAGRTLILAPAFPRHGRTTRHGIHHLDGVALHRSDAWAAEQRRPPRSLRELAGRLVASEIHMDIVRSEPDVLAVALQAATATSQVVIGDAETDADLDAIVAAAGRLDDRPPIWVGSGGLAAALARTTAPRPVEGRSDNVRDQRFLAVVGSAAPAAHRQAEALCAATGAIHVELSARTLATLAHGEATRCAADLMSRAGGASLVVTVAGEGDHHRGPAIAASLARVTAPAVAAAPVALLTGGATARAVLDACGAGMLELTTELEPGVVLARPDAGPAHVVTKAGTFGDDGTLVRALVHVGYGERKGIRE